MAVVGGENAVDTLNGWFKELYASQEIKLVPEAAWLLKNVKFNKAEAGIGNKYHQPVLLTSEHGVTYADKASGAFALEAAVASVLKDATIEGTQIVLRSQMDYEAAARAANSKASFGDATGLMVENMLMSISKRLEIMFLYGQTSVAALTSSGAVTALVVSAASWAPAIWAGMEGAKIEVVDSTGATSRTSGNGRTISSIDLSTRTINVSSAVGAGHQSGDLVYFFSSMVAGPTYKESLGLDSIATTSGTLFGIVNSTYQLFKGSSYSVGGALTVTKILSGLLTAIGKGLMEDVVVLCSPKAFQGLVNPTIDPGAQGGSTNVKVGANVNQNRSDKMVFGASEIEIIGNQGRIKIVPHLFVKEGEAFAFPLKRLKRIGATDVTFNLPGRGDEFFLHLPSNAGFELRAYANQALFCETPGWVVKYTSIS